jgi:hypothetical protein
VSAAADPEYDLIGVFDTLAPGIILQREILDAVYVAYAANGYKALSSPQVIAALQTEPPNEPTPAAYVPTETVAFPVTLPTYPTGLPRFADSNPATDGWCIDNQWESGAT